VPDEPFPRLNDLSSWQDDIRKWPLHLARQLRDAARSGLGRARRGGRETVSGDAVALPTSREPEDTRELLVTER
jgi:hypothetical protein